MRHEGGKCEPWFAFDRIECSAIDMAERGERHPGRGSHAELHDAIPLADLGIEPTQSHRWQLLARMDEDEFEAPRLAALAAPTHRPLVRYATSRRGSR